MERFVWQPGIGLDDEALARIRKSFKRPREPMGEAWFMGERRFFHELQNDLASLSVSDLKTPLEEIASGTSSFGPIPEWNAWYHYLLSELLPRSHESFVHPLIEVMITGFIALHPNGIDPFTYRGFRDDALLTLGRCMMDGQCWDGMDMAVGTMLHRSNNNPAQVWGWWDASGDLSASIFFCLKYLPDQLTEEWLYSILKIPSPHWRAQLIAWFVGAHDILTGHVLWPSELRVGARPSVAWEWSHCLRAELATADRSGNAAMEGLLSEKSRLKALEVVGAYFTDHVFLEWLDSISSVSYLQDELAEIPSTFEALYVRAH